MTASQLNHKPLFKDTQSTENLLSSSITSLADGEPGSKSKARAVLSLTSLAILALVIVNAALACANIRTTQIIALQTLAVLPEYDTVQLNKPDQYDGLSDASRLKLIHPEVYTHATEGHV